MAKIMRYNLGFCKIFLANFMLPKTYKMETNDKVLAAIKKAGKPVSAGEVAELSKLDRKEVDKAMKLLKERGAIVSPRRCYWEAKK
jgi:hypothetical protein